MSQRVIGVWRDGRRLVALAPALVIFATALVALPGQAGGYRLTKWGVFGAGLGLTAIALLARRAPLRLPRGWYVLAGFVVIAALLPALSSSLAPSHWLTALGFACGPAFSVVTATALADDDDARRASLILLLTAGGLCALLVLAQAAGLQWLTNEVYTDIEFRAPGTLGNPNWAAAFIAPLVPLALGLAATATRRRRYLAVVALLAIATLATLSKGGALTLATGLLVYLLLNPGISARLRLMVLGAAMAAMAVGCSVAWHLDLFTTAPWLRGRLFLWRSALHLTAANPLTGVGLGGYPAAYGRAAAALVAGDSRAFLPLSSVDFAHNDLLQLAAEGGVLTALAFVALGASAMAFAANPLTRASSAAVAAIFVNGLADAPMRVPSTFVLFFFLLGFHASREARAWGRVPLFVLIAVVGLLQAVRFTAGNVYWTRGRDALRANRHAAAALARARFFMPEHGRSASHHARALARAGELAPAVAAATEAAALRFDFDDEIFRRDLLARSLERDAAIREWQELSTRFPMLVTPYLRLGALYLQANDRAAAIAAYETVLASSQATKRADDARNQAQNILRTLLTTP